MSLTFYKLILGVVILSFVIPIKPPVSHAQAKLCCKKFCAHQVKSTPKPGCLGAHKKTTENRPVNCCQDSCAQEIFRDDSQIPALGKIKTEVDLVGLKLAKGVVSPGNILTAKKFPFWDYFEHPPKKNQSTPIYLTHSSFLI